MGLRLAHLLLPLVLALAACLTSGCIATSLSDIDAEPGFDWDVLKRDQIVMTPLLDLRGSTKAAPDQQETLKFFTGPESAAYAESFKQQFFKLRKDIRVFGAGGAFNHVAKIGGLASIASKVFAKQSLSPQELSAVVTGMQEIRFLFFFAVTSEALEHEFNYVFRRDQELDVKYYKSTRHIVVRLALWDSKANKTVWIGTQQLEPSNALTVEVRNPTKRLKKQGETLTWVGLPERTTLHDELARNREKFPSFPGREPALSGSFDDFALALPIQPSEAKLIEYEHFTYHRPELALRTSALGSTVVTALQLGSSSVINYHLRVGGAFVLPLGSAEVELDGKMYDETITSFGLTLDYEWELSDRARLLAGAMLGATTLTVTEQADPSAAEQSADEQSAGDPVTISDGALHFWPRVHVLFGRKAGFQWGVGAAGRFYDGIEDSVMKVKRPAPWSLDLSMAYAFRGF